MLTEGQKARLERHIYSILKESIFENGFFENGFFEKKKEEKPKTKFETDEDDDQKRGLVMKWLDSEQDKHSVIAYELWPGKDKDQARSDFSKAWRGEDAEGKPYSFTPEEINTIYNIRNKYIKRGSLNDRI